MSDPIDIVVTWLDPSDETWLQGFHQERKSERYVSANIASPERFRDWDNLRYWFRGIEQHAPWVNKIHFVTFGHLPEWLNIRHEKLNIVRHEDYIDSDQLPTFNSRTLELNLVNLEGLSEQFILFNDDFFLIDDVFPETFFRKGLPCDMAALNALNGEGLSPVAMNNLRLLNEKFDKARVLRSNLPKWFNPCYGKEVIKTLLLLPWPKFTGFVGAHLPQPYLKSNLKTCWELYDKELLETCRSKFRMPSNVNHYLFRWHHLLRGEFFPHNIRKNGTFYQLTDDNAQVAAQHIRSRSSKMIVINDSRDLDFQRAKSLINGAFQELFPIESSYECGVDR